MVMELDDVVIFGIIFFAMVWGFYITHNMRKRVLMAKAILVKYERNVNEGEEQSTVLEEEISDLFKEYKEKQIILNESYRRKCKHSLEGRVEFGDVIFFKPSHNDTNTNH